MPSVQHVSSPSAFTPRTMSSTGARSRSFGPRHAAPMQKRVAPAAFAARAASTTRVEIEQRLVRHAGVIARRLRAIAAILGAPARLDRHQRRELHGVRRMMRAVHLLRMQARGPRTAAQTAPRSHRHPRLRRFFRPQWAAGQRRFASCSFVRTMSEEQRMREHGGRPECHWHGGHYRMLSNFGGSKFDSAVAPRVSATRSAAAFCVAMLRAALPQDCALCAASSGDALVCERMCARNAARRGRVPAMRAAVDRMVKPAARASQHRRPMRCTIAAWRYAFPADRLLQTFKYGGTARARRAAGDRACGCSIDAWCAAAGPAVRAAARHRTSTRARVQPGAEIARRVALRTGVPLTRDLAAFAIRRRKPRSRWPRARATFAAPSTQ